MRPWRPPGDRHHPARARPKLIGRDPFAIDAIFEELRRASVFEGGFAGALITALTGIEIALWDLEGQGAERPDLRAAGRQVPRQDPRLRRLRGLARHELRRMQEGRRRGAGGGVHGAQDRPRHPRLRPPPERGGALRQGPVQSHRRRMGARPHGAPGRDGEDGRRHTVDVACDVHTRLDVQAPSGWPAISSSFT